MKIILTRENMFVALNKNKNVMYTFKEEEATDFANTTVNEFIDLKTTLEKKEECELNMEFVRY